MTEVYHIETSLLIWSVNQWTSFDMIGAPILKELIENLIFYIVKTVTAVYTMTEKKIFDLC